MSNFTAPMCRCSLCFRGRDQFLGIVNGGENRKKREGTDGKEEAWLLVDADTDEVS